MRRKLASRIVAVMASVALAVSMLPVTAFAAQAQSVTTMDSSIGESLNPRWDGECIRWNLVSGVGSYKAEISIKTATEETVVERSFNWGSYYSGTMELLKEYGEGDYGFTFYAYSGKNWGGSPVAEVTVEPVHFYEVAASIQTLDHDGNPVTGVNSGTANLIGPLYLVTSTENDPAHPQMFYFPAGEAPITLYPSSEGGYAFVGVSINGADPVTTTPAVFDPSSASTLSIIYQQVGTLTTGVLECGEGHEDFAADLVSYFENSYYGMDALNPRAEGHQVLFDCYSTYSAQRFISQIQYVFDECYDPMVHFLGFKPWYSTYEEWSQDRAPDGATLADESYRTVYVVWYIPITELDITIANPTAGTEVTIDDQVQSDTPRVVLPADSHVTISKEAWREEGGYALFNGIFEAGSTYQAYMRVTPDFNYVFEDPTITVNGEPYDPTFIYSGGLNIEKDLVAGAQQYCVNTKYVDGQGDWGTVSDGGLFEEGATATVTARPARGFAFLRWVDGEGNMVSTDAQYTFTVTGDVTLTAMFEADKTRLTELLQSFYAFMMVNYNNLDEETLQMAGAAFNTALSVLNDPSATPAQVSAACSALAEAYEAVKASLPEAVDRGEMLLTLMEASTFLDQHRSELSSEAIAALESAGSAAASLMTGDDVTQAQVDEATANLKAALQAAKAELGISVLFADVPAGAWYYDIVYDAVDEGLITGYATDPPTFKPNANITRGQVATILFRASGEAPVADNPFTDVPEGQYYSDGVKWCASQGIVTGYGSGSGVAFKPNANVSRQELAVMIARYAAWNNNKDISAISGSNAWASLKGAGQVANWAKNPVAWAVDHDIIGSNGNLNPKGNATRAEATKMILLGVHVYE